MAEEKGLQSLVSPRSRTVRGEEERMLEAQRLRREQLESLYKEDVQTPGQIAEDIYGAVKGMDTMDQIALGTAAIPIVGDIAGGIADTRTLINEFGFDRQTAANLGFLLAGLVPFVPSGSVARTVQKVRNQPKTDTGSILKAATNSVNFVPNYYAPGAGPLGKGLAYLRTIPKVAQNIGKARYNPTDRAIQKEYNLSVTDREVAQNALRISQEQTPILKPIEEQMRAMKKSGSAYTGEVKKGKKIETEEFKKLDEDAKAIRSKANTAGKKAIGQLNQSRSITKQRLGTDSGLEGLIKNMEGVDHVKTYKSFNKGEGDYFEKVGDLIPTGIGRQGVDQIFKAIKTLPAIGYNPKKNYQMNIRRVYTGSAGKLDQGMDARLYPSSVIGKDGMASLSDMKKEIFSKPIGGQSKSFEAKTYKTNEDFLKRLDEKGIKILNRDEMLRGIKEGRNVPAVITGSAKTDAYELGSANYMTAINKDGKAITILNDEHDLGKMKLPLSDRYINVSEPIVTDLTGKKITTKKQAKKKAELQSEKDIAAENAITKYEEIPGVKVRELNAKGKYEYLTLPAGFKTHEQWARTQAVAKAPPTKKDYSGIIKDATIGIPTRVARATRDREEEQRKGGGSVIERNPYGYPPRAI